MLSTMFVLNVVTRSASSSGRTSPACSTPKTTLSAASLALSLAKTLPSNQQGKNGRTLVLFLDPKDQSRGGSSTPNFSAWPNAAVECFLSQVLDQTSIPPQFFLSEKACDGITRRIIDKKGA